MFKFTRLKVFIDDNNDKKIQVVKHGYKKVVIKYSEVVKIKEKIHALQAAPYTVGQDTIKVEHILLSVNVNG